MKNSIRSLSSFIFFLAIIMMNAQEENAFMKKSFKKLPDIRTDRTQQTYSMTAVYINRDLTGNFTGKTMVSGEYTRGLPGDSARWNNAFISESQVFDAAFPAGKKLDYMENFVYLPSSGMMSAEVFGNFPSNPENIFARNLIWDMLSFETFAWKYYDSLKLNVPFIVPDIKGEFEMAEIGNYSHQKIVLCWEGVTRINKESFALISFTAADNLLTLDLPMVKSKGTEQYWGTILISLKTKLIENAVMYSGTVQELTITGMKDKILAKTIRELKVERIR